MRNELPVGAAERIRELAQVVVGPDLEPDPGADIVVVGGGKIGAGFMSRAGGRPKTIATPGIGADRIARVIGGSWPRSMVSPKVWPGRFAGWSAGASR